MNTSKNKIVFADLDDSNKHTSTKENVVKVYNMIANALFGDNKFFGNNVKLEMVDKHNCVKFGEDNQFHKRPDFVVRDFTTQNKIYFDVKNQDVSGTATERSFGYFTPKFLDNAKKTLNVDYCPFVVIYTGAYLNDYKVKRQIESYLYDEQFAFIRSVDFHDNNFIENIKRKIGRIF